MHDGRIAHYNALGKVLLRAAILYEYYFLFANLTNFRSGLVLNPRSSVQKLTTYNWRYLHDKVSYFWENVSLLYNVLVADPI